MTKERELDSGSPPKQSPAGWARTRQSPQKEIPQVSLLGLSVAPGSSRLWALIWDIQHRVTAVGPLCILKLEWEGPCRSTTRRWWAWGWRRCKGRIRRRWTAAPCIEWTQRWWLWQSLTLKISPVAAWISSNYAQLDCAVGNSYKAFLQLRDSPSWSFCNSCGEKFTLKEYITTTDVSFHRNLC